MNETEIIAELIAALEMSNYEFLTLKARLSEPYRSNAQKCYERGTAAVKAAKNYYDGEQSASRANGG